MMPGNRNRCLLRKVARFPAIISWNEKLAAQSRSLSGGIDFEEFQR
jgi:hypothetical protein